MTGYVRQAEANIQADEIIDDNDLNAEYDAIEAAFDASTGHNHDGTVGGGAEIAAGNIFYNNTGSGLLAENAQAALDEIKSLNKIVGISYRSQGAGMSTSTTTAYGGTLSDTETYVPTSPTSHLLVIFGFRGVISSTNGSGFASLRTAYYDGSAWQAVGSGRGIANLSLSATGLSSNITVNSTGIILNEFTVGMRGPVSGNWAVLLQGYVSNAAATVETHYRNIILVEYEP